MCSSNSTSNFPEGWSKLIRACESRHLLRCQQCISHCKRFLARMICCYFLTLFTALGFCHKTSWHKLTISSYVSIFVHKTLKHNADMCGQNTNSLTVWQFEFDSTFHRLHLLWFDCVAAEYAQENAWLVRWLTKHVFFCRSIGVLPGIGGMVFLLATHKRLQALSPSALTRVQFGAVSPCASPDCLYCISYRNDMKCVCVWFIDIISSGNTLVFRNAVGSDQICESSTESQGFWILSVWLRCVLIYPKPHSGIKRCVDLTWSTTVASNYPGAQKFPQNRNQDGIRRP